jgi:sortase A
VRHGDFKMSKATVRLRRLERALFITGMILMSAFAFARISSAISASLALQRFEEADAAVRSTSDPPLGTPVDVDTSLWSSKRILEYKKSLVSKTDVPLAVLRIPKLRLEVPVFEGTDELTLSRGAGWIIGTAKAGESGNMGIAAHRDGFFRVLKDISAGDEIELRVPGRTDRYVVTSLQITTPEDLSVLQPTGTTTLTLVTCFPFYFVGEAPERYIVHASTRPVDASSVFISSAGAP